MKTLFIRDLDGRSLSVHDIPIQMTVKDFVKYFANEKRMAEGEIRLLFGGKELKADVNSEHLLMDYGVMDVRSIRLYSMVHY